MGIALAGLGELDDSLGDDFVGEIAAVRKPKGYASHFEREAQDALGLGVEFGVVQEWGDRHGRPLVVQAGARLISQPPAPVRAATRGDEVLGAIGGAVCTLADLWHAAAAIRHVFTEPPAWTRRLPSGQQYGARNAQRSAQLRRVRTISRGDLSLEGQGCTLLLQRLLCRSRSGRVPIAHPEPDRGRFRSHRSDDLARPLTRPRHPRALRSSDRRCRTSVPVVRNDFLSLRRRGGRSPWSPLPAPGAISRAPG